MKGLDEDWSKVDPEQAWKDGFRFAVGYVSQDATGKNFTVDDVSRLRAVGFAVGFVYEFAPNGALGGYQQGVTDATIAIAHAQGLSVPAGVALYTAVDFNPTPTQLPLVLAYVTGFLAVCATHGYRSGAYGGLQTVNYLQSHNYGGFLWQTYAWSGVPPVWLAGVALRQVQNGVHEAGATIDVDESMAVDFGQWGPVTTQGIADMVLLNVNMDDGTVRSGIADGVGGFHWVPDSDSWARVLRVTGLAPDTVSQAVAKSAWGVDFAAKPVGPGWAGVLHVDGDVTVS